MIPILQDNYVPIITNKSTKTALVIDPGMSGPILSYLNQHQLILSHILLTHHHADHTDGVADLVRQTHAKVTGFADDAYRLPALDERVIVGQQVRWENLDFKVMFLPGHTLGHITYYCESLNALFSGDVLFLMGCGRLFEGTPAQMFDSLQQIKQLPPETLIYCAHEYTLKNAEFSLKQAPHNIKLQARYNEILNKHRQGKPTVPERLEVELETNLFLTAKTLEEFAHLRRLRDSY